MLLPCRSRRPAAAVSSSAINDLCDKDSKCWLFLPAPSDTSAQRRPGSSDRSAKGERAPAEHRCPGETSMAPARELVRAGGAGLARSPPAEQPLDGVVRARGGAVTPGPAVVVRRGGQHRADAPPSHPLADGQAADSRFLGDPPKTGQGRTAADAGDAGRPLTAVRQRRAATLPAAMKLGGTRTPPGSGLWPLRARRPTPPDRGGSTTIVRATPPLTVRRPLGDGPSPAPAGGERVASAGRTGEDRSELQPSAACHQSADRSPPLSKSAEGVGARGPRLLQPPSAQVMNR